MKPTKIQIKYGYVRALTALALFVSAMVWLLTVHGHVLFYQEQHNLFLFTSDYYAATVADGGLVKWLGNFIIQFYYHPWLGASVVSLMLTGVYLLTGSLIFRLTGLRDLIQVSAVAAIAMYFTLCHNEQNPGALVCVLAALFLLWIIAVMLRRWLPEPRCKEPLSSVKAAVSLLLVVAYIIAGYFLAVSTVNRSERAMLRAEKAIKEHRWDDAVAITSQYLATGRSNKLMLYFRSVALAEKGELLEHLFDFQHKFGQEMLSFPWKSDSREAEYGHLVHEITGNINAAHHWAFEAMTAWGETAPHLLNLTRYNMALGRPEVARKFARRLSHSLFYAAEAKRLLAGIDAGSRGPLRYAFADKDPKNVKWVNVFDFRPNLMDSYTADPGNNITRQYLLASMMLSNSLRQMIPLLTPEDLKIERVREAVLIYSLDPQATPISSFGITVNDETGKRFAPYMDNLRKGRVEQQKEQFGNTFWYYIHYTLKTL